LRIDVISEFLLMDPFYWAYRSNGHKNGGFYGAMGCV